MAHGKMRWRHLLGHLWRQEGWWQLVFVAALTLLLVYGWNNLRDNLAAKGIASGFDLLWQRAGFAIGESGLAYQPSDSYGYAFVVGIGNTLRMVVAAIAMSTLIGLVLGFARYSQHPLLAALAKVFVGLFRNVPLLLQLLAWYALLIDHLPAVAAPISFASTFLAKSGWHLPWLVWGDGGLALDWPQRYAAGIDGGACLTPEFLALWFGLSFYSAAYLGEIVRAGLSSVPPGQVAAARALGFSPWQTLRLIVWPQSLKLMIPPAANQYSGVIKSSALAITVGYPDLVSVANTTLNQSGRVLECTSLIIIVYALLSLLMAWLMGRLNRWVMAQGGATP